MNQKRPREHKQSRSEEPEPGLPPDATSLEEKLSSTSSFNSTKRQNKKHLLFAHCRPAVLFFSCFFRMLRRVIASRRNNISAVTNLLKFERRPQKGTCFAEENGSASREAQILSSRSRCSGVTCGRLVQGHAQTFGSNTQTHGKSIAPLS